MINFVRNDNLRKNKIKDPVVTGGAINTSSITIKATRAPQKNPTRKNPTRKTPTRKTPTRKNPTQKNPTRKNPTRKKPTQKKPTQKKPTQKNPITPITPIIPTDPTDPTAQTTPTIVDDDNANNSGGADPKNSVSQISPVAIMIMVSIFLLVFFTLGILLYRKYFYYRKARKIDLEIQSKTIKLPISGNNHRLSIGNGSNDNSPANNNNGALINGSMGIAYNEKSLEPVKKFPNIPPVIELNRISTLKINYNKMVKVAVLGASGGIGQPLSLLLKLNEAVTELAVYDVVNTLGVAADLSHISTPAKVTGYLPANDGIKNALINSHLIIIPAGIVKNLATSIAQYAPNAYILVISNPVNSTVPIFAEVLKQYNVFNPKKLFGVTTLDIVRSSTFTSSISGADPRDVCVPVVGGHSGVTIIPLLSKISPSYNFTQDQIASLTNRIQFGGDEVVKAKDGTGSATLSMAYAGAKFASSVLDATVKGKPGIIVQSYINLDADKEGSFQLKNTIDNLEYFSTNIELGPNGVSKILPLGNLTEYEQSLLKAAISQLKANINKGVSFMTEKSKL
ncbi:15482_t:CDS:2 [Entrophospora sp. SA101]|nr:15482_t:CDS:2 [Entrophospora sp. SA101]